MPEVVLAPIFQRDTLHLGVERVIDAYFEEAIFGPLLAMLEADNVRANAAGDGSAVIEALRTRQIWYAEGAFTGYFNAAISRELRAAGATRDRYTKGFFIDPARLPMSWRIAVSQAAEASKQVNQNVLDALDAMQQNMPQAPTGMDFKQPLDAILTDLQKQFSRSLTPHGVGVPPELTEQTKEDIRKQYTTNLDLYIKDFAKRRIPVLRQKAQDNVFAGGRTDKLAKLIQAEHGVSKRKAAFLAEQETSLLVSKYRESRYKQLGSRRYVWSTSQDGRVRHDHRELNKKIFYWDQPPVTNRHTGEHNNPGEDFGCRCIARPILAIQES